MWVYAVVCNVAEYVILHTCKEISGTQSSSGIAEWKRICNFYKHCQIPFQEDQPTCVPTSLV